MRGGGSRWRSRSWSPPLRPKRRQRRRRYSSSGTSRRRSTSPTRRGRRTRACCSWSRTPATIQIVEHRRTVGHPFLDISGIVDDGGERGLLSVAFPPDYATSGLFYVYFTNATGNNEVDEFSVSPTDPTDALESTRRRVIVFHHPLPETTTAASCNSTATACSGSPPATAAGRGDPQENAQNLHSPLGKLLLIDPRRTASSATRSRRATRSSASRDVTRSTRTACATRGASRSTATTSSSVTSARNRGRRSTTRPSGPRAGPTSAGTTTRAHTCSRAPPSRNSSSPSSSTPAATRPRTAR